MISALFVNYRSWDELEEALDSLLAQELAHELEVIVVDNASPERDEAARRRVRERIEPAGRLLLHERNEGYASGMNLALDHAHGAFVLVCNPDVLFVTGCVQRLCSYLDAHPDVGAVTPETFAERGLELRLPTAFPSLLDRVAAVRASLFPRRLRRYQRRRTAAALRLWEATDSIDVDMFPGWCFLMRRELIDRVGFLDERYPLYFEDTDLSLRIRRSGYRIVQVAGARLVHHYNRSGRGEGELVARWHAMSRRAFYRRWYGPPGAWIDAACERVAGTHWAQRRVERIRTKDADEVRLEEGVPVVRLGRASSRFLVEVCLDPFFLLAAGAFGSGDTWRPGAELQRALMAILPDPVYLRFVDLEREGLPELGFFRLGGASAS